MADRLMYDRRTGKLVVISGNYADTGELDSPPTLGDAGINRPLPTPTFKEDFQVRADDEEAEAPRLAQLRSLLNRKLIAGALAPQIEQPGLDYEIGRGVNTLRPGEERAFQAQGMDMRGVPRSTALSLQRYGDDPETNRLQLLRLLQGNRRLDMQEEEMGNRGERFGESLDLRRSGQAIAREGLGLRQAEGARAATRLSRPPAGQLSQSLALMTAKDFLDSIQSKFEEVKSKVGPVWGRLHQVARKVGWDDPRVSVLQGELVDAMGAYLTTQTGAQRGMKEVEFLLQALPGITQGTDTFEAMMQSWRERIDRQMGARERLFSELGYKGSGAEPAAVQEETPGGGLDPASMDAGGAARKVIRFRNKKTGATKAIPFSDSQAIEQGRRSPDWEEF